MPQPTRRTFVAAAGALLLARPALSQGPARSREIRIGALYPETGPLRSLGQEGFRGLELAVEARNAAGGVFGRPVTLLRRNALNAAQAPQAARQLISAERVAAVFGTAASPLSIAASQAAELQGIPYFELGAPADGITARDFRFVFRAAPTATAEAVLGLQACTKLLPALWDNPLAPLRVFVLHEAGAYGQSVGATQESLIRQGLGPIFAGRFGYPAAALPEQPGTSPPSADFAALVTRMREARPDVVLHTGYAPEAVALLKALRMAGWAPRMIIGGASGYGLGNVAQQAGADLGGVMVIGAPSYVLDGPLADFAGVLAERYASRYGAPPASGQSLQEALGATVFLEALHRAGSPDPERIRTAAMNLRSADSPPGFSFELDDSGQNRLARPFLCQWQGHGGVLRLVTLLPQAAAAAPPVARMALAG